MDVVNYQCPACGAPLKFSSESQKWDCEFCESSFELSDLKDQEQKGEGVNTGGTCDPQDYRWGEGETAGMLIYSCEKCGGEIIADATTSASFCPYCGNTAIFSRQLEGVFRPEFVIPFKKNKEDAKQAFLKLCKGKPLLPREFMSQNHIDKITGVYVPFWLYDCDTDADILYQAKKVKSWTSGSYHYTKTDYYAVRRAGEISFYKIPADGSKKMDDTLMGAIEPYAYDEFVPFSTAYLSGYLAEKYDEGADLKKPQIDIRVKKSVEDLFRNTVVGYSSVSTTQNQTNMRYGKTKYVLLPVWMLNSTYKEKQYTFAMNGQTGKLIGNLPISIKRLFCFLFGILGGVMAAGYLLFVIYLYMGGAF
ncbi:MAG: hypothetical protein GX567_14760 [Clostridia bacterium]|nr:hypothetical protein [Clostridia bacterium]